jgi:uncharacterized repeat protein (TIGR01451 family)
MEAEGWIDVVEWRQVTVDLSDYVGDMIQVAWHGEGDPWYLFNLDDVVLPGTPKPISSRTIELVVMVDDPTAAVAITNTATLSTTHAALAETTVRMDQAYSYSGLGPDLSTSYKEATAEATTGGEIVYEVHVINTGKGLAEIEFTDPIPAGTTFAWLDADPPYHYFAYDAVNDQVEWMGNIGPGDEWIFTFAVTVDKDPALWYTDITNVATVDLDGTPIELEASTTIGPSDYLYLPLLLK